MPRIRFFKQREETTCGPILFMNLLRWAGQKVSIRELPHIKWACGWTKERGTPGFHFLSLLDQSRAFCQIKCIYQPTIERIDQALQPGQAVVVRSRYVLKGKKIGHVFLVTDRTEKSFFCVNVKGGDRWLRKSTFERLYMGDTGAWVLRRNQ